MVHQIQTCSLRRFALTIGSFHPRLLSYLFIQFMESEVQSFLHVLPPVLEGEFDAAASWYNGNKLPTHTLSLK